MAQWHRPRRTAFVIAAALMFNTVPVYGGTYKETMAKSFSDNGREGSPSDADKGTASNGLRAARQEEGTVYYVDAVAGDDKNDGKTEETAWKSFDRVNGKTFLPGDKILLKADGIWNQPLNPKGSGREGAPIIIDMYGEGNRPIINGNGTSGPSITGAVTIYNEEHWEIYNLEVTNLEATDEAGESMDSGTSERAGILIYSSNQKKVYDHIVVKNCYVHDVNSSLKGGKTSGGIIIMGHYLDKDGNRVTIDDNGNLTAKAMGRAAFSDVLIEGNYVKNVAIEGIRNKCNTDIGSSGWGRNEFLKNFSDVTIRNNYLQDVAGDGIVLTETIGGLVEGNMVNSSCGMDRGKVNYAQCWTMFADDVVVQYNEVYGNKYGYDDGEAFDSDMNNKNNIFQYNLSHDCGGGAMLFMASQDNTIFRYNISINDGLGTFPNGKEMQQQLIHYDNTAFDTGSRVGKIYNNTFVTFGQGKKTALYGGKSDRTCFIDFKNNIVLAQDGAVVTFAPLDVPDENGKNMESKIHPESRIENNCIWPESILNTRNGSFLTKEELEKKGNIFADPKLVDYDGGKDYSDYVFPLEELEKLADSDFTKELIQKRSEPYALTEGSPCIQAGQRIEGMPTQDLMGNTIAGRADIGALEFSVEDEEAESVEEVKIVTMVGVKPELPHSLGVTMDGKTYEYPVEWDELREEDWTKPGVIKLPGHLPGLSNQVEAMIVVAQKAESAEVVEVTTYAGIYPTLPEYVTATFEGNITADMKVEWEKLDVEKYSKEGVVEVKGRSGNLETEFVAKVTVIGTIGDGKTVEEVIVAKDGYAQEDDNGNDNTVIKIKTATNAPAYTRRGLIAFDLTGKEENINSATKISIKMQMTRPGVNEADWKNINKAFYLNVYETEYDTWEETGIKWSQVSAGDPQKLAIENKRIVYADIRDLHNYMVELDVTDWVKKAYKKDGQTKYSFLMATEYFGEFATGDNGGIDFASKERAGAMAPTMVLSNVYETGTEELAVSTPAGKAPVLPEQVKVMYSDGSEKTAVVEWDEIRPAQYGTQGTFQVWGKAEGVNIPVVCKVTVLEALAKVAAVKEIQPIIKMTETPWDELGLPETVKVVLDNGQEADVKVQYWFPDCAYDPTKEFFYTCIGYLDLEGHESIENPNQMVATVNLSIIEPEDKNALLSLYTEVAELLNQGEADKLTPAAKERLMKAFNKASELLVDFKASREDIHQTYWDLMNAVWDMEKEENLKADTKKLEDLVLIGESKNKKDYTEESYEVLKDALEQAKEILKDKTLTLKDQDRVNQACDELKEAIDGLEFAGKPEETRKVITGIKIVSLPEKTIYKAGEEFSMKGLSVEAVYDDGTTKHISGYHISGANTSVPGTKTVVVTYRIAINDEIKVFTDTFEILVKEKEGNEPGTDEPGTDEPGTDEPGTDEPGTDEPGTDEPGTDEPGTDEPGTDEPGTDEPGTDKPGIDKPSISRPGGSSGSGSTKKTGSKGTWSQDGASWRLRKPDGSYAADEWVQVDGKWYRFNQKGYMQTGWFADGQNWYRLGEDGAMETGWVKDADGFWYYLDESGAMKVGWVLIQGRWYYLNPVSKGKTGWSSDEDGAWSLGTPEKGSRPLGAMYLEEETPDGHRVDANGAWNQ